MQMRLKGQGSLARLEVDSSDSMAGMRAVTRQARLMVEGSHERPLASGGLIPSFEMGCAMAEGTAPPAPDSRLAAACVTRIRCGVWPSRAVRVLLDGARDEWGMGGRVQLDPCARGHGLSFSQAPEWGETTADAGRLWDQGLVGSAVDDGISREPRVAAQIGYGIGALGGRGVLTPYAGIALSGEASRLRGGGHIEVAPSLDLNLEGERRETDDEMPEHAVMLRGRLRF